MSTPPSTNIAAGKALLDEWIATVQRREPQAAAALYAEEGMAFWGTFGDHCRTSPAEALNYFERFLAVDDIRCKIESAHWRAAGPDTVLTTGAYAFEVVRDNGPQQVTRARFTFAFQRMPDDSWKIIEHHSSTFPAEGF